MILGVDFGREKTGTALLHPQTKLPYPYKLIRESNARKIKREILSIVEKEKIEIIVFGLPLSDEGKESKWCEEIRRFAQWVQKSVRIEILFVNEYGTSKEAEGILRGKKIKSKKKNEDNIAAVLILENYISLFK